ncbi:MAG: type II toxin-antitoxin system VapC family toxin [Spirosomaceae bacterium]|nr:type II toxin-antitoxin system VapC family toxin [Spirosomataceae bacterium]
MYLLDSNLLIYSALPDYAYLRPLLKDPSGHISLFTTLEVLGYHRLDSNSQLYFESVFYSLNILPITSNIVEAAITLRQQRKLSAGDAIIAATALHFDLELLTRNTDDFGWIPHLRYRNPIVSGH